VATLPSRFDRTAPPKENTTQSVVTAAIGKRVGHGESIVLLSAAPALWLWWFRNHFFEIQERDLP